MPSNKISVVRIKRLILLLPILLLTGCYCLQSPSIPMETFSYPAKERADNNKQRKLMVLLPGIGDGAEKFYQHGVVDAVQHKYPDMDVIAVNAHFKYYQSRTIVDRLHADVIKPARAAGYTDIYLGGISLGGFGSLLYLKQYPDEITKVLLMAPYLGEQGDYQYLQRDNTENQSPGENSIWPWFIQLPKQTKDKIYLAYGAQDKFAQPNELFARSLSPEKTAVQEGKHNWKTWKQLWPELLATE